MQNVHDAALFFLGLGGDEAVHERGGEQQRQHDGAADGVGVGPGHRREDDARDAGHRKQRQKGHADDERREAHRPGDLGGGGQDALGHGAAAVRAELAEDVLDHDDR